MASMAELGTYLTGGAANSDPDQSTGGIVSSTKVLSQSVTGLTTITGLSGLTGFGNAIGDGTLTFNSSTTTVTWTPKNGTTGTAVDISVDGTYFVQSGSDGGALELTVVAGDLPTSTISNTLTVANEDQKLLTDVSKTQSDTGTSIYHCFALKNSGTDIKKDVTIWVAQNTPGQDTISLAVASAAAGDGATTGLETDTTDETIAPTGPVFTAPTTKATGLSIGDLSAAAGSTHTRCFWVKQLVPAGVDEEYLSNNFVIGVSARV